MDGYELARQLRGDAAAAATAAGRGHRLRPGARPARSRRRPASTLTWSSRSTSMSSSDSCGRSKPRSPRRMKDKTPRLFRNAAVKEARPQTATDPGRDRRAAASIAPGSVELPAGSGFVLQAGTPCAGRSPLRDRARGAARAPDRASPATGTDRVRVGVVAQEGVDGTRQTSPKTSSGRSRCRSGSWTSRSARSPTSGLA